MMRSIGVCVALATALGTAGAVTSAAAAPAVRTATVRGQVFADRNSNARPDHGEGLAGAKLKLENWDNQQTYRVTTGADGRFRVVVPTGHYYLSGGTHRWKVIPKRFHLHTGGRDLTLRAVKPLGRVLKADLHFTKDKYHVGDRAHIVITLTNTGPKVLRGIGAECDHAGDPYELFNRGPGWGRLAFDGPGVTLEPHTTRTFDVHDKVPAVTRRWGEFEAECDFGYPEVDEGHRPSGYDIAKVPGEFGAIAGDVGYSRHGKLIGLKGVRVVLADPDTCPVYTRRTTTDAHGHFRIGHAPAGTTYMLYLYPPARWKVRFGDPNHAFVIGNHTFRTTIEVRHGHRHVPDPPTKCS